MAPSDEEHERRVRLRKVLEQEFNREELRVLCFDLNIPYDNLGGDGHSTKALEVVLWCQRNKKVDELEAAVPPPGAAPQDSEAWLAAMGRYRERIEETCGWMQVLGQAKPAPLDDMFTEVYLLDKPTAWRRFSLEKLQEEFGNKVVREQRERRLDGLAFVTGNDQSRESQRLFILGKPGAGKTTFLKQVALRIIRQKPVDEQRVPIFITLKRLADSGKSILDFIVTEFTACQLPLARGSLVGLLRRGKTLVLFDGLDEVPQSEARQASLVGALREFVRDYPKNQYLVTCRVAATDYAFEGFTYVETADLTPAQVTTFVGKWFRDDTVTRNLFLKELHKPDHRPLQELATVPLLLTLLCLAFEETLTFPQRRVELYEEALDAMLKKWDSSRRIRRDEAYHKLSLGRKRELFAEIAWQSFEQGRYFIPQEELATHLVEYLRLIPPVQERSDLDGEAILKAIEAQHGVLLERARRIYSFAHLAFQEYYAARYVVEHHAEASLIPHTSTQRWREVLLLITSLLPRTRADAFFEQWTDYLARMSHQPRVAEWITWANNHPPPMLRSTQSYLTQRSARLHQGLTSIFIFDLDLDLDLTLNLDLDLARTRARARDLDHTLDHTLDHALDLARALARAQNPTPEIDLMIERSTDLDYALACDYALELAYSHALDLDMALVCLMLAAEGIVLEKGKAGRAFHSLYQQALQIALTTSDTPELNILNERLRVLEQKPMPPSPTAWEARAMHLRELALSHLALPVLALLTQEAITTLETYLASTHRLLECLEVAHVSDKDAILDALLRPPGWTRE